MTLILPNVFSYLIKFTPEWGKLGNTIPDHPVKISLLGTGHHDQLQKRGIWLKEG